MMQFSLTPEQIELRDSVTRLMRDYPDRYWPEEDSAHAYPWDFHGAFAMREGDSCRINGEKAWTMKAGACQKALLLVRTAPLAEHKTRTDGMSLFLADLEPKHVKILPTHTRGRNEVASNKVFIHNPMVPVEEDLILVRVAEHVLRLPLSCGSSDEVNAA